MGTTSAELDDQVAVLLHAGATYRTICRQLEIGYYRVQRVRAERQIPLPIARTRRSPQELKALEERVVAILRAGATYREVREATRFSLNRISSLRRQHSIPVPDRSRERGAKQRRTVDEAFDLYTRPTPDGHLLWTGPRSGRGVDLLAEGRKHNARAVAFQRHHGREPEGRIWRARECDEPCCIAGAHHTDQLIRHGAPSGRPVPGRP